MSLTGSQFGRIQNAILAAFKPNDLRRVLRICMDLSLDAITSEKLPFQTQVFELVERADRNGHILALLECVRKEVPNSATLAAVWAEAQGWDELERAPAPPQPPMPQPPAQEPPTPAAPSDDVNDLVARMQDTRLRATARLWAGLRAADLGDLPPDLHAFIPIPGRNVRIGKYPVTNAQFKSFTNAGGYALENELRWWSAEGIEYKRRNGWIEPRYLNDPKFNRVTQPVVGVSWYEAEAYCNWLSEQRNGLRDDEVARLPNETEWEAAARGGQPKPKNNAQDYPWGGPFRPELANTKESNLQQTAPVHMYPDGATPQGVCALAGNVWEWTVSSYAAFGDDYWLKGGSWYLAADKARASAAARSPRAGDRSRGFGFRVIVVPISRSS